MKQTCILSILLILTASLAAFRADATQIVHRTPQQMGTQADLVVTGKVAGVQSFWNANHTKIFTETTIEVDQTFKGSAPRLVKILQLGGRVDNIKVNVAGALKWASGEEVLLFLEPYTPGSYQVSGFSQGKFNITADPITGRKSINYPEMDGVQLIDSQSHKTIIKSPRPSNIPLERFINQALGRK